MNYFNLRNIARALEALVAQSSESIRKDGNHSKELLSEINSLRKTLAENKIKCIEKFDARFMDHTTFFAFNIHQHISLFLLIFEQFNFKDGDFKHIAKESKSYEIIRFYALQLCNLSNSLISIRILLESGFNLQAKQIFRSYIELADIAVASLASADFFDKYKSVVDGEEKEREVWWNYTRPKSLSGILKNIYHDMFEGSEFWEMFKQIREPYYKHQSDYVHGHYIATAISAMAPQNGDDMSLTLLGAITDDMEATLEGVILYSHLLIKHSMISLVKYHNLPFMHFGEHGNSFVVQYKMGELYLPHFIKIARNKKKF